MDKWLLPDRWKPARLKIIKKQGDRDWTLPNSYRPISLLPTIGKIYERLVTNRLTEHLDVNNGLSQAQYGFRKGRSTVDAIERVKNVVLESQESYVVAILVDISGAFDSLWWTTIYEALNRVTVTKTIFEVPNKIVPNKQNGVFVK